MTGVTVALTAGTDPESLYPGLGGCLVADDDGDRFAGIVEGDHATRAPDVSFPDVALEISDSDGGELGKMGDVAGVDRFD